MITGLNMKKTYLEYRKGGGTQKSINMKIYTSRYGNKEIAKMKDIIPVGISLYPPRWKLPYKVHCYIKQLAPTNSMIKMECGPYKRLYTS